MAKKKPQAFWPAAFDSKYSASANPRQAAAKIKVVAKKVRCVGDVWCESTHVVDWLSKFLEKIAANRLMMSTEFISNSYGTFRHFTLKYRKGVLLNKQRYQHYNWVSFPNFCLLYTLASIT